jgi:hypothetical protein
MDMTLQFAFEHLNPISPKLSIVLLDWSCRESFHILDYLDHQSVPRVNYEVIWIEYYTRRVPQIEQSLRKCKALGRQPTVDRWVVMGIPENTYYHKHLMYNVGVLLSRGRIVAICDSDAIVKESFVAAILGSFEQDPNIVLHLDQARNNDKRFYPFNYPTVEEVLAEGCINWRDGKTVGLCDTEDVVHTRNYGACMAALREDLVKIGGADEHIDYLGHICGPYEMTFRLVNSGKKEVWHPTEFLYHVWHPGQAGENNYVGPHDGRHVSSRALQAKFTGRIFPFLENSAIRNLGPECAHVPLEQSLAQVLSEERLQCWSAENVANLQPRLWRTLLSFQRRIVAVRLVKTFLKLLLRRVRTKAAQLSTKARTVSEQSAASSGVRQASSSDNAFLSLAKATTFLRATLEFCLSMTHRSRDCLNSILTQGHSEVSIYGTDDVAEILYDLTFDIPVKLKNIYGDPEAKRFHIFKVLPIESYGSAKEPLIITGSTDVEKKVKRLKSLGVSSDRLIVVI